MKGFQLPISLWICILLASSSVFLFAQEQPLDSAPAAVGPQTLLSPDAAVPEVPSASGSEAMLAEPAVTPAVTEPVALKYVVFLPERVDLMWFWYYYTDIQQYFVQSAVEKALLSAGKELVDLSTCDAFQAGGTITQVTNPAEAIKKAASLGAVFAVIGQADAVKTSESVAYGVGVYRANANANARIIRVRDGKMLATEEATAQGGGQSVQGATQDALKNVGRIIAAKIAAAAARAEAAP